MGFYDAIRVGASGAADTGFTIDRSVRISRDSGNYFSINNSSSGNTQTFTFSFWMKLGKLFNNFLPIYSHYLTGNNRCGIVHTGTSASSAGFQYQNRQGGSHKALIDPAEKIRDHSAWYHVVFRMDTTNSTQNNRFIIYVNGREITQDRYIGVVQNSTSVLNSATTHYIGHDGFSGTGDFYLADIHLIDGQALDASHFAETDATTGQWIPKEYTGSYSGTSYHLKFDDNSSASALGTDSSGLGNDVTPVNFSVAAGAGNDSVEDTPTNNWATLNVLHHRATSTTFSNGNLQAVLPAATTNGRAHGNFVVYSGKWYWEAKYTGSTGNFLVIGVCSADGHTLQRAVRGADGELVPNTGTVSVSFTTNDVIMVALDVDNGKWYIGKNGSYMLSGDPVNGTGFVHSGLVTTYNGLTALFSNATSGGSQTIIANFGQQGFTYTPPTGFKALNSANLPDPTILLPNKHFDTLLYTGNNGTQNITGLNFDPDWVWAKNRPDAGYHHDLYDRVRGDNLRIFSSQNSAEATGYLQFGVTGGFSLTAGGGINANGSNHVAWNWDAGETDGKTYTVKVVSDSGNKYRFDNFGTSAVTLDLAEGGTYIFNMDDSSNASHPFSIGTAANGTVYTSGITYFLDGVSKTYSEYTSGFYSATTRRLHFTVPASAPQLYYWCSVHSGMGGAINTNSTLGSSNFDGSNQTTVKVNATAGFSIISYTGTGSLNTIGHGLGVTPKVYIIKNRDATDNWIVYTTVIDNSLDYLHLNLNSAKTNSGNTAPTSSVIEISGASTNDSGNKHICYAFSEVAGYSKFGSYVGNGSSDGTFVFVGFRPAVIIIKNTTTNQNWGIFDNKRSPFNTVDKRLTPDSSGAEATADDIDFVSNGFKHRSSGNKVNSGGKTYIFLAFAESPFKNARAR